MSGFTRGCVFLERDRDTPAPGSWRTVWTVSSRHHFLKYHNLLNTLLLYPIFYKQGDHFERATPLESRKVNIIYDGLNLTLQKVEYFKFFILYEISFIKIVGPYIWRPTLKPTIATQYTMVPLDLT